MNMNDRVEQIAARRAALPPGPYAQGKATDSVISLDAATLASQHNAADQANWYGGAFLGESMDAPVREFLINAPTDIDLLIAERDRWGAIAGLLSFDLADALKRPRGEVFNEAIAHFDAYIGLHGGIPSNHREGAADCECSMCGLAAAVAQNRRNLGLPPQGPDSAAFSPTQGEGDTPCA